MDPKERLTKIIHDLDPMTLRSPVASEYSYEAGKIAVEMQYVTSPYRLSLILYDIFSEAFSQRDASIDWMPLVNVILNDDVLKKQLGRLA